MNSQTPAGMVTGHNLMSFIEDLSLQDLDDLTDCTRIATASADMGHNRFTNSQLWFEEYANTLDFLGWSLHEGAVSRSKCNSQLTFLHLLSERNPASKTSSSMDV